MGQDRGVSSRGIAGAERIRSANFLQLSGFGEFRPRCQRGIIGGVYRERLAIAGSA